ncbi:maleylpyruvate isomerase N-terminal domain-containing protein [Micromonospora fiedleri]|uniref:Maleylpyruvate isomerase N-terminal domain-containing protein n=1 Tax=Micromonospora fiedleri TaxID=1157498 RepID=A0ABS1UI76_9ACTN|nr:maleylpyruvate isomerase N-terminal domain-containing protein [Micromonospora fiedleri]MBL6275363.1 maleylpyruvate isomerase N-terminal domain-containing protein [Micromonospora fiedleri]
MRDADFVRAAFREECLRLGEVLATLDPKDLARPTGCVPWTVAELLAHVRTGAGRLIDMLAAPPPNGTLVDAAGYFGAAKFTPEVDAARIESARAESARIEAARGVAHAEAGRIEAAGAEAARAEAAPVVAVPVEAARVGVARGGAAQAGDGRVDCDGKRLDSEGTGWRAGLGEDFERAWRAALAAVEAYPTDRVVRTRHGDAMTVTEFLRTRVVEVGVHGLDLAVALDRPPWLTTAASRVIADLLTAGRSLPAELGWDRLTLIAKVTGRMPCSPAEQAALARVGLPLLAFGP